MCRNVRLHRRHDYRGGRGVSRIGQLLRSRQHRESGKSRNHRQDHHDLVEPVAANFPGPPATRRTGQIALPVMRVHQTPLRNECRQGLTSDGDRRFQLLMLPSVTKPGNQLRPNRCCQNGSAKDGHICSGRQGGFTRLLQMARCRPGSGSAFGMRFRSVQLCTDSRIESRRHVRFRAFLQTRG
jgi:hypothetical protein